MSRKALTGSSDPSFLGFACRVSEYLERLEAEPQPTDGPMIEAARSHRQHRREALIMVERALLQIAGVPATLLPGEAMERYIGENVDLRLRHVAALEFLHRRVARTRRTTEEGQPRRWTVVEVIVGTHCAFGGGNRAETARMLCRGIGHRNTNWGGVGHDAVRNSIDTFARRWIRDTDLGLVTCVGLAHRARVMDGLWTRLQAEFPNKPTHRTVQYLASTGDLIRWYDEIDDAVFPVPDLDPAAKRDLLDRMLNCLDRLQARLAAA